MNFGNMIGGIGEGVTGIVQAIAGHRMYKKNKEALDDLLANRPEYNIPGAIESNVGLAERMATRTRMPGQDIYEQRIGRRTSQGIRQSREAATTSGDLLAAVSNLYGQEADALADLEVEAARQRAMGERTLMQARDTYAQYRDKAFNWNVAVPYQAKLNQLAKQAQAGFNTWQGGSNRIASSFQTFAGSQGQGAGNVQQGMGEWNQGSGVDMNWSPQSSGNYGSLSQYNRSQYGQGRGDSLTNWNQSQNQGGFSNPSLNAGGLNF